MSTAAGEGGMSEPWTPEELDMRRAVEAGGTVVASQRKGRHARLIAWARGPDAQPVAEDPEWRRGLEVYIGRRVRFQRRVESPWHNPYKLSPDATPQERAEIVRRYREEHLPSRPDLLARLPELRGKVLVCWCHPEPCHGDVLVELLARTP